MTLPGDERREIPAETAKLGRILLGEHNLYRLIGDQLSDLVTDEEFSDLYAATGGPAISPAMLALVVVFQMLEKLADRQAAEALIVRIDWKYALHLPLDYPGFWFTNLSHFRTRVLAHEAEYRVFDRLVKKLVELGYMRRKGKQRTDSTHILGLVADLNRLELVWESLRVGLWALEKEDGAWVEQQVPASFMEEHGIKRSDYRMSEAEMQTLLRRTGADGWWLLQQLARAPQNLRDLGEVQTLRTVWQQQFEVDEDDHYQGPRKSMKGSELIQNPHDPEVQYSEKRGKGWKGYRAQVSETAEAKGDINFITDVAVTKAQLQDVSALPEIQARLAGRNLTPNEQVVDQAYVSTQMLAMSDEQGIRLVGPLPTQPTTGLFQIPDFQIDLEQRVAICPAGCRSQSAILSKRVDRGLEYVFAFGKQCATCSLRQRCTTARNGRTLRYHSQHCFLENRQAEMQTEAFWEEMKARPPIEGTLSQLVRQGGRRARYRGLRRVNLQWILTAMAVNLKRLRRAWATNYQPSWAVALLD